MMQTSGMAMRWSWHVSACHAALFVALSLALMIVGCGSDGDQRKGAAPTDQRQLKPEPALPSEIQSLPPGLIAEQLVDTQDSAVRIAVWGSLIFYAELSTGDIFEIDTQPDVPVVQQIGHIDVVTGGERGLIGLVLSPSFSTDNHLFVMACVAGPERQQVVRFEYLNHALINPSVIVDDLPIGMEHNGGGMAFMRDGTLLIGVGDTGDPDLAQMDGELAGRILRYNADGTIPASNPDPASPEYCRGLRNPFGLFSSSERDAVYCTDNGPTSDDTLCFIQAGRNFGWPMLPPGTPSASSGLVLRTWHEVIAPTGISFTSAFNALDASFADSLYVCSYVDNQVLRLRMSGAFRTDVDEESVFLHFADDGFANKPLSVTEFDADTLIVSTFDSIFWVRPWGSRSSDYELSMIGE